MRDASYFPKDFRRFASTFREEVDQKQQEKMHLCEQPMNLTRRACCQLVLLLNDTTRVPPCSPEFLSAEYNESRIHIYSPPSWIDEPPEIAEDHATFLIGIFILVLIAVACTFTLNKLTKPKITIGYGSTSNYDFMMWMPTGRSNRRWSMLVLLREMTCRRPNSINRNSDISVVSSHIGLLPSYQSATTTPSSQIPPPPYSETRRLTADA